MFVSYSEVRVNVINKHVQHVGIIGAFCLSGGLYVFQFLLGGRGQKKLLRCGLLGDGTKGGSVLRLTLCLQKKFSTYTYKN